MLGGWRKGRGKLGAGEWALPGGHLEFAETFEQCAAREVLEETGLTLQNIRFERVENCIHTKDGKAAAHYVTIFMRGTVDEDAAPQNLEPDKCEGWQWVEWGAAVPRPAFQGLHQLLEASDYDPFSQRL